MKLRAIVVAGFMLAVGHGLQALALARQASPLTGAWIEASASGTARPAWGSRFTTTHDTNRFTVVSPDRTSSYALDGTAVDTPLAWTSCASTARRTRAEYQNGQIVITESIVTTRTKTNLGHAPCVTPDDEEQAGPSIAGMLRPTVALETITVVSRKGDLLVIEVTRRGASAGLVTTTTAYQPESK